MSPMPSSRSELHEDGIDQILRHVRGRRRQLAEAAQHEDDVQAQSLEPALDGVGHAERRVEAGLARSLADPSVQRPDGAAAPFGAAEQAR
jgi:hypothetical protein